MALITCPECNARVSDRAANCPYCGCPLSAQPQAAPAGPPPIAGVMGQPVPPAPPVQQAVPTAAPSNPTPQPAPPSQGGPQVGLQTQALTCPYCHAPIGSRDILSSGWAKCPSCKQNVPLAGANGQYDDNVLIEKLYRFGRGKDAFHRECMQYLMNYGAVNVFDELKVVSIKRKAFWVREFGTAQARAIYPLCDYGKEFFRTITYSKAMLRHAKMHDWANYEQGATFLPRDAYEFYFSTQDMVRFNSDDIRDVEVLPKEQSAAECRHEFSHLDNVGSYAPTPNYYLLPVFEEVVEYMGQEYTFVGTGNAGEVATDFGTLPVDMNFFMSTPNWTTMQPVTWTLYGLLALIGCVFAYGGFSESFWTGIGTLVALGVIAYFFVGCLGRIVTVAVLAITGGIDTLIQKAVNKVRRNKFRAQWQAYQEHKKQAAKRMLNLDLTYTVPEFPIP